MIRTRDCLWCISLLALGCSDGTASEASGAGSEATSTSDAESDTGESDTSESDTSEPDTSEPDTSEPDTSDEDSSSGETPICGDGILDADEVCDAGELGGETCVTQGFDSGALACAPDCSGFDTAGCGTCGNDLVDGSEDCDGQDLDGQTCASQGRLEGSLACASDCQFDLGSCTMPVAPTLLLTQGATVQARDLDGVLLSSTVVPLMGGTENELRELTHYNGVTYLYRGTFTPTMTYYDEQLGDWVHESFPGWSTINNLSYGGLAATEGWIWATDTVTAGASEVGLVRFSLLGLPTERVRDTQPYIDVFAGPDGFVYALRMLGKNLDVVDPETGALVETISLAEGVNAIAVDEDGVILGASSDGHVYSFDAAGIVVASLAAAPSAIVDIDVTADGTIAVGTTLGDVVIIEPGLAGIAGSFATGPDEAFLEFL